MGMRSHIMVIIETANAKRVIANYYHWNYMERMLSRARHGIEWMQDANYITLKGVEAENIFDVNFDMRDYQSHLNLLESLEDDVTAPLRAIGFEQDGGLIIHLTDDGVRYALVTADGDVLSPIEYMEWDSRDYMVSTDEYIAEFDDEQMTAYKSNIEFLNGVPMLTQIEVEALLDRTKEQLWLR